MLYYAALVHHCACSSMKLITCKALPETIKKLSKFVGESIPVVDSKTKQMKGIISENTVLQAYLDVSEEINFIEKN